MAAKKKAAPKARPAKKAPRRKKQATSSAPGESASAHKWLMESQNGSTEGESKEITLYAQPTEQAQEAPRKKTGRPSDYRIEYCTQAEKLCRLGATDAEIATFFNVAESTIYKWKLEHPEFSESIREGKIVSDMNVADALYRKATGYVLEMERIIGKGEDARVLKYNVTIEPDTQACSLWLRNRRGDNWRDKRDVEVTLPHEDALQKLMDETGDADEQPDQRDRAFH